jgi:hypothetical protein
VQIAKSRSRIFEQEQNLGAYRPAGYCCYNYRPSNWNGELVSEPPSQDKIRNRCNSVGQRFEKHVGVNIGAAKPNVERKVQGVEKIGLMIIDGDRLPAQLSEADQRRGL